MKLRKVLYLMVAMALCWGFSSCQDDDYGFSSDHTDASGQVSGTFEGTMYNADGNEIAIDVVATITPFNENGVQAIRVTITAASINMNQEAIFNIAKAGDNRYVFASGSNSTKTDEAIKNSGGVAEGNNLTLYLTLNSKFRFSTATAAKPYTVKMTKNGSI